MYWANFIHIYQPPTQTRSILERVVKESYRKIFSGLLDHSHAKLTLNINAGLTEMLVENGFEDVVKKIRVLLERGQLEITGSAKYHPLLPKLPEEEIIRQIKINEKTNRKFFGPAYHPAGFFPPEMGYSPRLGKIIKKLGFKWVILDEVGLEEPVNYQKTYKNKEGLFFFFREKASSFKILSSQLGTAKSLIRWLNSRVKNNEYLLTAMDGETFGHHRPGLEEILWEICKEPKLPTVTISQLLDLFPEKIILEPKDSSWALTGNKLAHRQPFIRWDDPDNEIHQKQWLLTNLAFEAVKTDGKKKSQQLLDKALYSDQYWWASARPWWSLEWIEKGANGLLKVIENCSGLSPDIKEEAEDLYLQIVRAGFEWQRSGKVEEMAKKEDEEIRERMRQGRPQLTKKDYDEMINSLKKQMLTAAKEQEYSQAEQLKKRINEIVAERDKIPGRKEEILVNQ